MDASTAGLSIYRERCIGSGLCLIRAAEYFSLDESGYVTADFDSILNSDDPEAADLVREAVEGCPSGAIAYTAAVNPAEHRH